MNVRDYSQFIVFFCSQLTPHLFLGLGCACLQRIAMNFAHTGDQGGPPQTTWLPLCTASGGPKTESPQAGARYNNPCPQYQAAPQLCIQAVSLLVLLWFSFLEFWLAKQVHGVGLGVAGHYLTVSCTSLPSPHTVPSLLWVHKRAVRHCCPVGPASAGGTTLQQWHLGE